MSDSEKKIEKLFTDFARKLGCYTPKFGDPGMAGAPDRLVHLPGGYAFYIEFKRKGGIVSEHQKHFKRYLEARGIACHICYTFAEAKSILNEAIKENVWKKLQPDQKSD